MARLLGLPLGWEQEEAEGLRSQVEEGGEDLEAGQPPLAWLQCQVEVVGGREAGEGHLAWLRSQMEEVTGGREAGVNHRDERRNPQGGAVEGLVVEGAAAHPSIPPPLLRLVLLIGAGRGVRSGELPGPRRRSWGAGPAFWGGAEHCGIRQAQ